MICTSGISRQQNHAGAGDDQHRVEPVEHRGFAEISCRAGFETEPFANAYAVEIGKIEAANSEALNKPAANSMYAYARQRPQCLGRVGGILDVGAPVA